MRVRILSSEGRASGELGLSYLALPPSARDYVADKLVALQLLLTGLSPTEARLLKRLQESPETGGFPLYLPGDARRGGGAGLLAGRLDQALRLKEALREHGEGHALSEALRRALDSLAGPRPLLVGGQAWDFNNRTHIMGVLNVTPDSFSDGGLYAASDAAVAHGLKLAAAGADIIDVGGESTRPGAELVSEEEELARVVPVIRALRASTEVPLSVDTRKAGVAEAALAAGASLVNDVSGLAFDPRLAEVTAARGAALCLMHLKGTPQTMQQSPSYGDVVEEVLETLAGAVERAEGAGVKSERILVDPGIGFGKSVEHNLLLLHSLKELRVLGKPVVVGTSRKSFLAVLTGSKAAHPQDRLLASVASVAALVSGGSADVVRVHDVAETREALAVVNAIRSAQTMGARLPGHGAS